MKQDQRYQPIGQLGDDVHVGSGSYIERSGSPYQDDPRPQQANGGGMILDEVPQQRSCGSPNRLEHPLQNGGDTNDHGNNNLRMRRQPLSREGSQERMVELESLGAQEEGHPHLQGNCSSTPPRPLRLGYDKNSNTEVSSSSEEGIEDSQSTEEGGAGNGSRGEEGHGQVCASHASSFDLLDDEDEINLQRYHRDFGQSPYSANFHDDLGWDNDAMTEKSTNMYHPRTESTGSHSKDPWIRMVQQNQQSPTHGGNMPLSSVHSASDLLLYLQSVRRQARQRRAQRLLTMNSEQWWERLQFFVMTYCWDATDVGLLVVGILLVIWFAGLLWLARINAREEDTARGGESYNGAEYNGNAEFDEYDKDGRSWRIMLQGWWWALGLVLLVRILGPFAVHNVNNRRRERRRQRFMSGNMQEQQRRMQQQQLPTAMPSGNGTMSVDDSCELQSYDHSSPASRMDSLSGVEITGRSATGDRNELSMQEQVDVPGIPMNMV